MKTLFKLHKFIRHKVSRETLSLHLAIRENDE